MVLPKKKKEKKRDRFQAEVSSESPKIRITKLRLRLVYWKINKNNTDIPPYNEKILNPTYI